MHYVVLGAGAVGSVLGGMLSVSRHTVTLVCREPHARAIASGGLRLRSATGDHAVRPHVCTALADARLDADACVFLTVKAHDAPAAIEELARTGCADLPVFTFQNGVNTEEVAMRHLHRVYGGVCRMTCSMIQPGHAAYRRLGRLIVGKFPRGGDATQRAVADDLEAAGFGVAHSRSVMNDKWLKLAVNTQSVFHAVIDPRDHNVNAFFDLKARILAETQRVFRAAKVRARSCDGSDPTIAEMIDALRRPRVRRESRGMKVGNSVWQDLYLRRPRLEAEYIHGPVIDLAARHGVPAGVNRAALDLARGALAAGEGPDTRRLREVLERVDASCRKAGT